MIDICVSAAWTAWSSCNQTCGEDTASRTRAVKQYPYDGGAACPAAVDEKNCPSKGPCNPKCKVQEWGGWSRCSKTCGVGTQTASRIVRNVEGISCPRKTRTRPCYGGSSCPIDCVPTLWTDWKNKCSQRCGGGVEYRTRSVKIHSQRGGKPCGVLREGRQCNVHVCPPPCQPAAWGEWGPCNAACLGSGYETRTRSLGVGGTDKKCTKLRLSTTEKRPCSKMICMRNCTQTQWGEWSSCSVTCGKKSDGEVRRARSIQVYPANGGKECVPTIETAKCSNPVPGVFIICAVA